MIRHVAEDNLKTNIDVLDNMYPYRFNDYQAYDELNMINTTFGKAPARSWALQYYLFECGAK